MKEYLEVGEIVGTHGIKGEMRIHPWSDSPDFIKQFKNLYLDSAGEKALTVSGCRTHGNLALLTAEGIDSVEKAAAMRGRVLYMSRKEARLAPGEYFLQDLIGCEVFDLNNGKRCGILSDVSKTGANDVWHIRDEKQKEYLIPAIRDVVREIDIEAQIVKITPLKGIFDDED